MCHPAVVDDEVIQSTTSNDQRTRELAILMEPEIKYLLAHYDIQLIRFAELKYKNETEMLRTAI